ncbi:hypothetical protein [Nocardia sp. NPDC060249]|uniref:hypothetical protein n=1 Tax=Nocardia sp. NPDC060249 TaxID=3347082 RepID=UPI00364CAA1E
MTELDDTIDAISRASVHATTALLTEHGAAPAPRIYLLDSARPQPLTGYITCRPYRRGRDAHAAITGLGAGARASGATHVVVTWEDADLIASISGPGDYPHGLAILAADIAHHRLTRHPFTPNLNSPNRSGAPTVTPAWHRADTIEAHPLPPCISTLLQIWRTFPVPDGALEQMTTAGYTIRQTPASTACV